MINYLILGFLLATIGMTILNCIGEIISAITELIKAVISVGIIGCNAKIAKLTPEDKEEGGKIRAIGFETNFEEDEDENE